MDCQATSHVSVSQGDQQFPLNLSCERKTICNMLFDN